jgi:hypothetical protein
MIYLDRANLLVLLAAVLLCCHPADLVGLVQHHVD